MNRTRAYASKRPGPNVTAWGNGVPGSRSHAPAVVLVDQVIVTDRPYGPVVGTARTEKIRRLPEPPSSQPADPSYCSATHEEAPQFRESRVWGAPVGSPVVVGTRLHTPPPLPRSAMRVTPLGGLGDIGRNMTIIEYHGQLLIVDCGVLFPEDDHPGVDLILPGFGAIADRLGDVVGLVLTHGHEDHIGAVPYLLKQRPDIPLIGSKLTLALVQEKIREHRIRGTDLRKVEDSERVKVGAFDLEFVAVNHSIPDA